jgi:hypothetical protein
MQRAPKVFGADVETAARFFNALATEPDGIRATVQEAINRLAAAFKALPSRSARRELQRMLDAQSRSASESVRTCASPLHHLSPSPCDACRLQNLL